MQPLHEYETLVTRRQFFGRSALGVGTAALASLLSPEMPAGAESGATATGLPGIRHFAPRAKRVIYLFMHGGPSQMELLDYKPKLTALHGSEIPDSVRMGQRLTGMTSGQASFPSSARRSSSSSAARAAPGSASCCRAWAAWWTTCASSSRCTPRRSITTRR